MEINFPEKKIQRIVWTLLCLAPITGMAVDLIAPSLPGIAKDLKVSETITKNVIAIYLLGYALGNFVTGFLTDAIGRQKLIRLGLLAFTLASLCPVIFPQIEIILITRLIQGLTIGCVAVVTRGIYSDILPPDKLIRLGPLMGTMWGLGPVIGPVIGGYLQFYFGWKAGFIFFSAIALIGFIATCIIVPETHVKRHVLNITNMKNNLTEVFKHRLFISLALLMGLVYSLIIAFNTGGPFLIQTQWHYSSIFFGRLAFGLGMIFLLSTFICRFLLKSYKLEQIFAVAINVFVIIALIGVILGYFFNHSIILVTVITSLMFFSTGFIFPLSMGKGMSLFRHIAGTASAVMYLINILLTSLMAFVIGFISIQSAISIMWTYFLLTLLCGLIYWLIFNKESQK